jgi:hypothetical protein
MWANAAFPRRHNRYTFLSRHNRYTFPRGHNRYKSCCRNLPDRQAEQFAYA